MINTPTMFIRLKDDLEIDLSSEDGFQIPKYSPSLHVTYKVFKKNRALCIDTKKHDQGVSIIKPLQYITLILGGILYVS